MMISAQPDNTIKCDVLVVGAGINGAGIARDAAGRGLSVVLCDKDDIAAHTSSASTKLIHGGLRYLEQYEFALVRKALIEREILMRCAPHIIWPLRFVLPQITAQRSGWILRAGLFLYDRLARRELLPGSQHFKFAHHVAGRALNAQIKSGFAYSDCWVDDARLVILNAVDAAERGAVVKTRTVCEGFTPHDGGWQASLIPNIGEKLIVHARCIVNATGPWAASFLQHSRPDTSRHDLRWVKGSHIVVKKLFDHSYAYIFQHSDHRIIFAIPYEGQFTLIGTTDVDYSGNLNDVSATDAEVNYLCGVVNQYFKQAIQPDNVVWSYSGVRPLLQDDSHTADTASTATRDYTLTLDESGPPMLSVFGGKITTFRKLAEEAVDRIVDVLQKKNESAAIQASKHWTAKACLPGGDVYGSEPSNQSVLKFDQFIAGLVRQYSFLPQQLVTRYARAYGTRVHQMLAGCHALADMGKQFGEAPMLYEVEVKYLMKREWAQTVDDIVWRRSKLGLHLSPASLTALADWIATTSSSVKQL